MRKEEYLSFSCMFFLKIFLFLNTLFEAFGPIVETFSLDGNLSHVEAHCKECRAMFQQMRTIERISSKYNQDLASDTETNKKTNAVKNRIEAIEYDYKDRINPKQLVVMALEACRNQKGQL